MKKLKEILFLSDKGYTDLKKAIIACTITNLAMLLPFCITVMVFSELLNPFLGQELDWQNIWLLWGAGIISAIIVFLASKNDYPIGDSDGQVVILQLKEIDDETEEYVGVENEFVLETVFALFKERNKDFFTFE